MLNWDDPLAPLTPAATAPQKIVVPDAVVAKAIPPADETFQAEPTAPSETVDASQQATDSIAQPEKVARAPQDAPKTTTNQPLLPTVNPADLKPVNADDKRVINGKTDVNQLAPFKYPWAWEYFLNANKNHWTPLDINMAQDVQDYNFNLTGEERHVYENVMAYLTTSDILAMRNIGLAVMEKMTAPELQIYQARQVYEEALHTWTYQHCIESLGIDQGEIYNRYRTVPELNVKIQMCNQRLNSILRPDIDLTDPDELQNFIMSYGFFAGVFEGTWFYNGFSPIFALQRRGLMKGTAEQLQYIMRDEVLHASFGIRCVNQIMIEENLKWNPKDVQDMWDEAEAAEEAYAGYILRDQILGYSKEDHIGQFRYIANRRAKSLKMQIPFPGAESTLGWLDEQANMRKEKNFFETRVTEYQTGGALNWE